MEESGGVGVVVGRRLSLSEQMSAVPERRDSHAGLALDAVLSDKSPASTNISSRTLLDIIRDDDPATKSLNQKDRRSWKVFRDRLRLKRAGAAWTSSLRVPASDVNIQNNSNSSNNNLRSQLSRRSSVRFQANPAGNNMGDSAHGTALGDNSGSNSRPQFGRRASTRHGLSSPIANDANQIDESPDISMPGEASRTRSFRSQMSRRDSTRMPSSNPESEEPSVDPFEVAREGTRRLAVALAEERALSAREAVAAQEAAEAEAAATAAAEEEEEAAAATAAASEEPAPVRMSLMDLLEETDRQMGLEGSRYTMAEDDEEEYDEEEEDEAEEDSGGIEYNCCVCMVRHKGAAFIPCGHTFCRLCSRELWVQRGNCPVCNGFILEILDIF